MAVPVCAGWHLLDGDGEGSQLPEGVYVHEERHLRGRLEALQSFEFFSDGDEVVNAMLQADEYDTGVGRTRARGGARDTQASRLDTTPNFPEDGEFPAKPLPRIEQPDPSALASNTASVLLHGTC